MNKKLYLIFFALLCSPAMHGATITLNFKPYPNMAQALEHLKKPDKLAHHMLVGITEQAPIAGITGTYAGYLQASDEDGFMVFPRKQTGNMLYILVTPEISPILMFPHTVKEWILNHPKNHVHFTVTRTTDPETDLTYWDIMESPLDLEKPLPMETIILFANPQDLVIPTGITLTNTAANLQLPTIYSQNSLDTSLEAATVMNISYLFNPVDLCHVKQDKYAAEQPCVP